MRSTLASTIVLAALAVGPRGQAPDASPAIPETLRAHLRRETFTALPSVTALPAGVRDALGDLFGEGPLQLAEPGAPFQATDVVVAPRLPWRRLIAAGCAADHCLVHYEKGGFAHVFYVVVLSRNGASARFEWGGMGPGPMPDLQAVREAVGNGKVLGQTKYW
jgi:hypothetical protein